MPYCGHNFEIFVQTQPSLLGPIGSDQAMVGYPTPTSEQQINNN